MPNENDTLEAPTTTDLQEHVNDVKNAATDVARDIKNTVSERADSATAYEADQIDKVTSNSSDVVGSVRAYAAAHPFTAFGIGIAVGIFLKSRRAR